MNLLTAKQVAAKLNCAVSYVWKRAGNDKTFPQPRRLGGTDMCAKGRMTRWVEADVDNWLESLKVLTNEQIRDAAVQDGCAGADVHQDQGEEVSAEG